MCVIESHLAVTVIVYDPGGVPGLPFPPPPPCSPPPQETEAKRTRSDKIVSLGQRRIRRHFRRFKRIIPAIGEMANRGVSGSRDAATGAVVLMVNVTTESSLPDPTCVGLNPHVVSAGSFEQEKLTFSGNEPLVGLTSKVKFAGWPTGVDALSGVMLIVKSKV